MRLAYSVQVLRQVFRALEKIQSNLKPFLKQHWFSRWLNVSEMEKVVGQAEKDMETARMKMDVSN